MADKKITALTVDTAPTLDDILVTVNLANNETSRISLAKLASLVSQNLEADVAFRAYASGTTSVANEIVTTVAFDTELYDLGGNFDTDTHEFTAPYDGVYHFDFTGGFDSLDDDDSCLTYITVGETNHRLAWDVVSNATSRVLISGGRDFNLSAGDIVRARVYHNYGAVRNATGGLDWTNFSGHLVGRT
jgi:hypothetical protein